MPKLRKEKIDEIKKMIDKGYTNTEIHEKTGVSVGVIRRIRKEMTPEEEPTVTIKTVSGLSSDSLTKIGYMQGMYGAKNPDEAIEQIYEDVQVLMQLKYRFDKDVKKTPGEVLSAVVEEKDMKMDAYDNLMKAKNSTFHQMCLFKIWEIDNAVKAFFDMYGVAYESIFQFMQDAVIGSFKEHGHKIEYYTYDLLGEEMPIITTPNGIKIKFPVKS